MQENSALGRALAMVRDLRARCPWDRAQTRRIAPSLPGRRGAGARPRAGRGRRPSAIRDELSDLLLHLAFQLVIAEERRRVHRRRRGRRGWSRRCGGAIRISSTSATPEPWERIKRREREGRTLAGITPTLPPLLKAYRLQERAASVGFDWPDVAGPLAKVREELAEVERELARAARRDRPPPGRSQYARRATERRADRGDRRPAVRGRQPGAEGRRAAGPGARPRPTASSATGSRRSSGWRTRAGSSSTARGSRRWTGCGTR